MQMRLNAAMQMLMPLQKRSMRTVPHVRQSFNWDCGFACTEMVLRALGVPASECSLNKLRSVVGPSSTSIWQAAARTRSNGIFRDSSCRLHGLLLFAAS